MANLILLLQEYGVLIVFAVVLIEQIGMPIPAFPILIVAGALSVDGDTSWPAVLAVSLGSATVFFAGSAIAGAGFGSGFQGGIRTVVPAAAPHERAGVLSLLFTVSYLGLGVPAVAAGFLSVHGAGLIGATRDYGVALIVLAAFAFAVLSRSRRAVSR